MISIIRQLDPSSEKDYAQFKDILDHHVKFGQEMNNRAYDPDGLPRVKEWMLEQFKIHSTNDFVVIGKFIDDVLMNIMVGYKFTVRWGRKPGDNLDALPYWIYGLVYFRDKHWMMPIHDSMSELSRPLSAVFERQNYYKIFLIKKAPNFLLNLGVAEQHEYFQSDRWKKQFPGFTRYTTIVERLLKNNDDIQDFIKFSAFETIVPKKINKPIMLVSLTLKPNAKHAGNSTDVYT